MRSLRDGDTLRITVQFIGMHGEMLQITARIHGDSETLRITAHIQGLGETLRITASIQGDCKTGSSLTEGSYALGAWMYVWSPGRSGSPDKGS